MRKKILVTGIGGYIGSIASDLFLSNDCEVVGLDNFSTGYRQPVELLQEKYGPDRFRFYETDLRRDLTPIFEKEPRIQAVVHFAAHCIVDDSVNNPAKYFWNNVGGTSNLLEAVIKYGIDKFVFSSTCAVYGTARYFPIDEQHPINPENPYGESKRIAEMMLERLSRLKNFAFVALRYFNVTGASADGTFGDSGKPSFRIVQNAVREVLGIEPFKLTCPTVDTPDGTPIRDYINVLDLADAHLKALEYLFDGGKSEIINLGTGTGNSVLEIASKVKKITGAKFEPSKTVPRKGECAAMIASIAKAKSVLRWQPQRTLEDSVTSLMQWYQKHPRGWEK